MHSLLLRLFEKRGIKDATELDAEEKHDFENWHAILSKDEMTVGDIKAFCANQVASIEMKWRDTGLENSRKAELIPYHTVYKMLMAAIDAPRQAKEQLEKQLTELIK